MPPAQKQPSQGQRRAGAGVVRDALETDEQGGAVEE